MIVEYVGTAEADVVDLKAFLAEHPVVQIVRIDGLTYHGCCENCGKAILGTELYYSYGDGIKLCSECGA